MVQEGSVTWASNVLVFRPSFRGVWWDHSATVGVVVRGTEEREMESASGPAHRGVAVRGQTMLLQSPQPAPYTPVCEGSWLGREALGRELLEVKS